MANASSAACVAGFGFHVRRNGITSQLVVNDHLQALGHTEIGKRTYECMVEQYNAGVRDWIPMNRWEYIEQESYAVHTCR